MPAFPSPWRPERIPGGYAIRDAQGKVVAHVYGQEAPAIPTALTLEEAREMAVHVAELPDLLAERKKPAQLGSGQRLGQRRDGELLLVAEDRTRSRKTTETERGQC